LVSNGSSSRLALPAPIPCPWHARLLIDPYPHSISVSIYIFHFHFIFIPMFIFWHFFVSTSRPCLHQRLVTGAASLRKAKHSTIQITNTHMKPSQSTPPPLPSSSPPQKQPDLAFSSLCFLTCQSYCDISATCHVLPFRLPGLGLFQNLCIHGPSVTTAKGNSVSFVSFHNSDRHYENVTVVYLIQGLRRVSTRLMRAMQVRIRRMVDSENVC